MKEPHRATNLEKLTRRFPSLGLDRIEPISSRIQVKVQSTPSGNPTVIAIAGDQPKYLHSAYNPYQEAERWAMNQIPPRGAVVAMLGWGLGHHGLTWIKQHGHLIAGLIVIEPEPALFRLSINHLDLSNLYEFKPLELVIGLRESSFYRALQRFIEPLLSRDILFLPLPFVDIYPNELIPFLRREYERFLIVKEGALRHMEQMGPLCQDHIVRNIPAMLQSRFLGKVKHRCVAQPAFIVAAGPSLDRNIDQLRCIENRGWIFAVDTSLKPLANRRITPHFVVSKDPTDKNVAHFSTVDNESSPILLFDPQVDPSIPRKFGRGTLCMPNRNHALHAYIDGLELTHDDLLPLSTNVAIAAFHAAAHMGCDPIVLVGLDLCFSNQQSHSHAAGTAWFSETVYTPGSATLQYIQGEQCDRIQVIEVEGIDGQRYPTTPNFYESLKLLESFIEQRPGITCIDASEGGARIVGTTVMSLREAIAQYCHAVLDLSWIEELKKPPRHRTNPQRSIQAIAAYLLECEDIARQALAELESTPEITLSIPDKILTARARLEEGYRLYHILQSALERLLVDIQNPEFWDARQKEWRERYRRYFYTIKTQCGIYRELFQSLSGIH